MITNFLKIKQGQYLADIMEEIPSNCIFNKVLTGVGATTLEIKCERNSIIIEPNVPVIKGKRLDYRGVLGVLEGIHLSDIKAYLLNDEIEYKKILTTPESFKKVKDAFEGTDYDMFNDFFLLFDECDKIITDIDYRGSVMNPLEDFFQFKNKTFISATQREISDKRFTKGFHKLELVPDFNFSQSLELVSTNNPKSAFKFFSEHFKDMGDNVPFCVFFNSIDGMLSLISELNIANESVVFCSQNGLDKIKKNKLSVYTDVLPSKMKRFNFFTSRFYSAVDIKLDYKPHVVFLTDLNIAHHSLFDPYSDMIQIAGRFRNGVNRLLQITNFNKDLPHLSEQEAKVFLKTNQQIYKTIQTLRDTSGCNVSRNVMTDALNSIFFSKFYTKDEKLNNFMCDNYLLGEAKKGYYRNLDCLLEAMNDIRVKKYFNLSFQEILFEASSIYTNNLEFRYSYHEIVTVIADELNKLAINYAPFKLEFDNRDDVYEEVKKRYPEIVQAYDILGYQRLINCGYSRDSIKKEIHKFKKSLGVENTSFRAELNMTFAVGESYRQTEMLDKFEKLTKKHGLSFKREIKDLKRFFELSDLKSKPKPKCRLLIAKKFID